MKLTEKAHAVVILFILSTFSLAAVLPVQVVSASTAEVQSNQGHNSSNTSYGVAFPSSTTTGHLLVATQGSLTTSTVLGVGDSQGNTWYSAVSQCVNVCVRIWYATAKSSAPDTVTFTTTSTALVYGFITEFSGTRGSLDKTSVGSGSGSPSVSSFSPVAGSVVVDVAAGPSNWSPGSGFSMIGGSYLWSAAGEYAVNWGGGSTTAAWSASGGNFGEVAASFYFAGTASLTGNPATVAAGTTTTFTATANGCCWNGPLTYFFDYGDGQTYQVVTSALSATASHWYGIKNTFAPKVTITDNVKAQAQGTLSYPVGAITNINAINLGNSIRPMRNDCNTTNRACRGWSDFNIQIDNWYAYTASSSGHNGDWSMQFNVGNLDCTGQSSGFPDYCNSTHYTYSYQFTLNVIAYNSLYGQVDLLIPYTQTTCPASWIYANGGGTANNPTFSYCLYLTQQVNTGVNQASGGVDFSIVPTVDGSGNVQSVTFSSTGGSWSATINIPAGYRNPYDAGTLNIVGLDAAEPAATFSHNVCDSHGVCDGWLNFHSPDTNYDIGNLNAGMVYVTTETSNLGFSFYYGPYQYDVAAIFN